MRRTRPVSTSLWIGSIAASIIAFSRVVSAAADDEAEKARLAKLDAGPKQIDVSSYPAEQKQIYQLASKKCSNCHSFARVVNTQFVLPGEWQRYIKRMMFKPDSKLSEDEAKQIYRFLAFDSSVRKSAALQAALDKLSAEDHQAELDRIRALNPAFGGK